MNNFLTTFITVWAVAISIILGLMMSMKYLDGKMEMPMSKKNMMLCAFGIVGVVIMSAFWHVGKHMSELLDWILEDKKDEG